MIEKFVYQFWGFEKTGTTQFLQFLYVRQTTPKGLKRSCGRQNFSGTLAQAINSSERPIAASKAWSAIWGKKAQHRAHECLPQASNSPSLNGCMGFVIPL